MLYSALVDTGCNLKILVFNSNSKTMQEIVADARRYMYSCYASNARKMALLHVGKYI